MADAGERPSSRVSRRSDSRRYPHVSRWFRAVTQEVTPRRVVACERDAGLFRARHELIRSTSPDCSVNGITRPSAINSSRDGRWSTGRVACGGTRGSAGSSTFVIGPAANKALLHAEGAGCISVSIRGDQNPGLNVVHDNLLVAFNH